ncbi:ABC transporter permease [candidate division KSB1 bacterium]|nr:ABC transporter permease [candidate division KSB1 bacterium]
MGFVELIRQVVANLRANKLRSTLTMFGITWGIASVMLLSGIASGFKVEQQKNFKALGNDVVIAWGGNRSISVGTNKKGDRVRWNETSIEALKAKAQYFRFSPELSSWSTVMRAGPRVFSTRLVGVAPEFGEIRNISPDHGRWLNQRDADELRRVCVIGDEVRKKLFGAEADPLHQTMLIAGREFLIVGWKSDKEQDRYYMGGPDNELVFVPYTTHMAMTDRRWFGNIVFAPNRVEDHDLAVHEFRSILGNTHKFDPTDEEAIRMWDTVEDAKTTLQLFDAINMLMVAIGGITLMIGGLGVMNIMLVSVVERTREIGVRRAIGARRGDIVRHFFLEALAITAFAGSAGIVLGWGLIKLLQNVKMPEGFPAPALLPITMIVSVAMIGLVTLLSGLYPAFRAAKVDPIEALRYE